LSSARTREFQAVFETLFKNKLSKQLDHGLQLAELMRLLRSTVHNNGLHVHRNSSKEVICNGKSYVFENMKAPEYLSWDLLIELLELQASVVRDVGSDQTIRQIALIRDSYIAAARGR
jgi:hypothetical protein